MGVFVVGCDVQFEVFGVFNDIVFQFDVVYILLFEGQFLEDWVKNWIKFFFYIF